MFAEIVLQKSIDDKIMHVSNVPENSKGSSIKSIEYQGKYKYLSNANI